MDPVFNHHLYEYEKGLRRLILHTVHIDSFERITERLKRRGVAYEVVRLGMNRANIFFGDENCVRIIRSIGKDCLSDYTPEEDFMLGVMLGYCREKQCERYLKLKSHASGNHAALVG